MPIKFNIIEGNFYCSDNKLTNLKGCPLKIYGNFSCNSNNLTSLIGCPKVINGDFYCNDNKLKSLEYCIEIVNGKFHCNRNKITSLEGCPEVIIGSFSCYGNILSNFEYFPKEIKGNYIEINKNNIKEEELVNFNCKIKNIEEIFSDFNKNGNIKEFLDKVNLYKSKRENELLKEISNNSNNIKLNKKL